MTKQILLFLFALLMGSVSVGQAAEPAALEAGMVTSDFAAAWALRMRVSISAMGSVILILTSTP